MQDIEKQIDRLNQKYFIGLMPEEAKAELLLLLFIYGEKKYNQGVQDAYKIIDITTKK